MATSCVNLYPLDFFWAVRGRTGSVDFGALSFVGVLISQERRPRAMNRSSKVEWTWESVAVVPGEVPLGVEAAGTREELCVEESRWQRRHGRVNVHIAALLRLRDRPSKWVGRSSRAGRKKRRGGRRWRRQHDTTSWLRITAIPSKWNHCRIRDVSWRSCRRNFGRTTAGFRLFIWNLNSQSWPRCAISQAVGPRGRRE